MQVGTFETIKSQLDIENVAARYGLQPDHHGKYNCLWHDDHHNSLSIDKVNNRLKCFSCGASISSVDLVMQLFSISNVEAAERLNSDFCLGLRLDEPPQAADMQRIHRERQRSDAFTSWENNAWWTLNQWYKILSASMKRNEPIEPEKGLSPEYIYAAQNIGRAEFLLDILTFGTHDKKLKFYENYRGEVTQIEGYIN
jgi:hypothetical protein